MQELQQEFLKKSRAVELKAECLSDGAFNSEIAIVGEAPGSREVQLKVPLVGGSGALLWSTLRKHSLHRSNFYITNVVKRQLAMGGLDADKVQLPKVEYDHWVGLLKWELACLPNLRYVLLLGNFALDALCGRKGITKWRGSVLDFEMFSLATSQPRTYKAVVANNPAAVLREPKTEISFIMDVAKLPMVMSGKWKPFDIKGEVCYEYKHAKERISYYSATRKPICFDIETGGGETACIGLADDCHSGTCIPFRSIRGENYFSIEEEADLRMRLQQMFADPERKFVAQNANFDMYWLWIKDKIRVHSTWFDTMLAHHCLYPSIPHDLGYLCTQYTTHPYYKDERAEWKDKGDIDLFWQYNVKDVCITLAVHERLLDELKKQAMDKFFFSHIMRLQQHLVTMTVGGVLIDGEEKDKFRTEIQEKVALLIQEFHKATAKATGDDTFKPNPSSHRDRSELYFQRLRLVGRGISTDAVNRTRMLSHPRTTEAARDVIRLHNEWAKEFKFLSTYAESKIDDDGRIRCEWRQTGTQAAPGRLSSAQTLLGTGANLQNQPTKARRMFIADQGYVFIYFDLSQAEARYVAWDAGIEKWKEQFERARLDGSYDCHRALASEMFKVPYEDVPLTDEDDRGEKTIRYIAKRCRHGLNYRMAADRLAETTGLSLQRAQESYVMYHRLTPELRRWWGTLEKEVRSTRMLYNAFGRRLYVMERLTEESLESIVAFKPQSTIGDKVSQVIYQSEEDDKWDRRKERICLNVHDALVGLAKVERAEKCLNIMKKYAEQPIVVRGEPLIIPADMGISVADEVGKHRWSNIKKVKL